MNRVAADVAPEQQQRILERAWETGTFRFLFETFDDVGTNPATNEIVCEFVRNKIRLIVNDPKTADLLCPYDHTLGSKRPPLGHQYYETFNRDNVSLVDVKSIPITEITPLGLRVGEVEHEFDVIIFATGFDAITGALTRLDVTGRDGRRLREAWAEGPTTYLSVAVESFPNMFMILGPQSPFAIASITIEHTVQFISALIARVEESGHDRIEATPEAAELWGQTVQQALESTKLVRGTNSWVFGANIPGKPHVVLQYFGGIDKFISMCQDVIASRLKGFALTSSARGRDTAVISA